MTEKKRPPMAGWIKAVIVIVIVGLISGTALLIMTGAFLFSTVKQSMDPESNSKIAEKIVKLSDPLPEGFTRISAIEIMSSTSVSIMNFNRKLTITIISAPKLGLNRTAADLLQEYEEGTSTNSQITRSLSALYQPLDVQTRGTMRVGGEEMPYVTGTQRLKLSKVSQMTGFIAPKHADHTIMITGQYSDAKEFKMDEMKRFLDSIKGF